MTESTHPLAAFSEEAAQAVERAAGSVVAVHGGGRRSASGIHWRAGVIVTAEETLERDEDIKVTLAGGREVPVTLAGRDPTTDVAVLRFPLPNPQAGEGGVGELPVASAEAASLRAGQVVLVVGNHQGAPLASLGIVALAGGPWHSQRGGTIDSFIRLDLTLAPAAEGGAVVDPHGRVVGMAVLGPRRRALAIPATTIDRAVDQLLARGHVYRGYLGAGLQAVRLAGGRGILVASLDPQGPAARGGLLVGDIVTAWNEQPIDRVCEVMRHLGTDSVGRTIDLALVRGGAAASVKVVIGERAVA
jgi:S1-C subfamily serine protease